MSFLKLPITHSSLFGEDFEKSSDKVVKEHQAISKVVKPRFKKALLPTPTQQNPQQPFRGKMSRGNFRGKRSGRGGSHGGFRGRGLFRCRAQSFGA